MTVWNLSLLGGFSLTRDNALVTGFRSAKSRALLTYLAMQPDQPHGRPQLATLLWGELPEKAARTNLRVELSQLKKLIDSTELLQIDRQSVRLDGRFLTTDALHLQTSLPHFLALTPELQQKQLPRILPSLDLYQGDFLAGFYLPDTPDFDNWQRILQEQLHEAVQQTLDIAQTVFASQGSWTQLAAAARRQLLLVPWRESAHRYLMQALASQGQRQAALAQYQACREILQQELGVEPALATQELARDLATNLRTPPRTRHNLPPQLQSFVGRETEIAAVQQQISGKRLVTLLGMGGVGKSRLAQAVAYQSLGAFPAGVWFVPLTGIEPGPGSVNRIALAIAAAIGWTVTQAEAALPALLEHLRDQQTLLVLDNWEHLIAAAEQVVGGLLADTAVHILATSRLRLNIPGEQIYPLAGLAPDAAVVLFIDRARRLLPDFAQELDPASYAEIDAICKQVRGLPLGIELAASWVEHISVAEIGASLADISVEPGQAEQLPDRHHSLTAVLTYSWRLLSQNQQAILARLSLFQDGFNRRAAAEIAECGLGDLSILLGHTLLQRVSAGRYNFHPLVHQFIAHQRTGMETADPAAASTYRRRFSHFYFTLLQQTDRRERSAVLQIEYGNVSQAWQLAVTAHDWASIQPIVTPFSEFVEQFGLMSDGYQWLQTAVTALEAYPAQHELAAQLLHKQFVFARAVYGRLEGSRISRRSLELTKDLRLRAQMLTHLANNHAEAGEWVEAEACFDEVETILQRINDPTLYVSTVEGRIHINALHFRGDFAAGISRLESLLPILDAIPTPTTENEYLRSQVLSSLTTLGFRYGAYDLALRYAQENEAWARQLGNQQELSAILLELALTELFAGQLPDALAHNLEALALAREINATDDQGLLQANLCLTLRQIGDLEQALSYGQAGAKILQELGLVRMVGQALNRVGHTQVAMNCMAAAYETYQQALLVWAPLHHPNAIEATAGLAAAAALLGQKHEAEAAVTAVNDFVADPGLLGTVEPALLYLHVEQAYSALSQPEAARSALQQASAWIEMISGRIEDTAVRSTFRNRPDNQRILQKLSFANSQ